MTYFGTCYGKDIGFCLLHFVVVLGFAFCLANDISDEKFASSHDNTSATTFCSPFLCTYAFCIILFQ